MNANRTLLDLFLEIQRLDRIPRAGYVLRGVDQPESVTEHSWHVLFLVWTLGPRIEGIDVGRAIEIALLHDLAEVRIGDLPLTCSRYFPAGAKNEAEAAALADILAPLPERTLHLYEEYQRGTSPEARLVKACDKLQLMIKVAVYESWGTGALAEFWDNPANFPDGGFPLVRELFEELRACRARAHTLHNISPPGGEIMPEKETIEAAKQDEREGKSPSTQAGEFVHEEIEHIREGKHGARSTKQAIAIGLSKARRAGVKLPPPEKGKASTETRKQAARDVKKGQRPKKSVSSTRSRAARKALKREGHSAASKTALSRQAKTAAKKRTAAERSASARKAVKTKGPAKRKAAAKKAARTRARST